MIIKLKKLLPALILCAVILSSGCTQKANAPEALNETVQSTVNDDSSSSSDTQKSSAGTSGKDGSGDIGSVSENSGSSSSKSSDDSKTSGTGSASSQNTLNDENAPDDQDAPENMTEKQHREISSVVIPQTSGDTKTMYGKTTEKVTLKFGDELFSIPAGTTVTILKISKNAVHAKTSDGKSIFLDPDIVEIIH